MIKFKQKGEDTLTFYHVTHKELLPKILKEGLRVSTLEQGRKLEQIDCLPKGSATGIIYLATDLSKLPIDFVNRPQIRKDAALLEIKVPREIYDSWDKDIDPAVKYWKTREAYIIGTEKGYYQKNPHEFPDFEKEIREETGDWKSDFWRTVFPKSTQYKEMMKEVKNFDDKATLVIKNNIPPEYIGIKKI